MVVGCGGSNGRGAGGERVFGALTENRGRAPVMRMPGKGTEQHRSSSFWRALEPLELCEPRKQA